MVSSYPQLPTQTSTLGPWTAKSILSLLENTGGRLSAFHIIHVGSPSPSSLPTDLSGTSHKDLNKGKNDCLGQGLGSLFYKKHKFTLNYHKMIRRILTWVLEFLHTIQLLKIMSYLKWNCVKICFGTRVLLCVTASSPRSPEIHQELNWLPCCNEGECTPERWWASQ